MTQAATSSLNRGADYPRSGTADDVADKASDLAGKASEKLEQAVSGLEQKAKQFAEQGRQAGEQVQVVADNFKTALDKSVKDQPMTTLVAAVAVGFVVGALWKS